MVYRKISINGQEYEIGDGDTNSHSKLHELNAADQHPMSAIIGLSAALKNIENKSAPIIRKKNGSAVALNDPSDATLEGLVLYGKTTQNGTPTPENPIPLVSAGDSGKIDVWVYGKSVYGADELTGEQRITVSLPHPLPPGEYIISAMVTTTDTDSTYNLVGFDKGGEGGGSNVNVSIDRGVYQSKKVRIFAPVKRLFFNASNTRDNGAGDTCTWSNVQIEVGEAGTEYEAYKEAQIMSVQTPYGLSGIPDPEGNYTDAYGRSWMCDEMDYGRGTYTRRVMRFRTDDAVNIKRGTSGAGVPYIDLYRSYELPADTPLLCNGYVQISTKSAGKHGTIKNYSKVITIYDDRFDSSLSDDECIALLNNLGDSNMVFEAVFKLSSPVEQPISDAEIALYKALHTNKPVTTILNDSAAGMTVGYVASVDSYINNKADETISDETYPAPVKTAWEQRLLDRIDLAMLPVRAQRKMAKAPSGYIQPGEIITGVVYSAVYSEENGRRLVGTMVSLSTYYSALENPASVMYTQDLWQGDTGKSTFYGMNCSGFVCYAFGWANDNVPHHGWDTTHNLAERYRDKLLDITTENDLFQIRRGDLIINTVISTGNGDHVKLVRDVVHDRATGKLVGFNVAESTKPYVRVKFMTPAEFLAQMSEDQPYRVARIPDEDYGLNVPEIKYSHTVYPDRGDGGKYTLGETVEFYIPDMTAESIYYSVDGGPEENVMLSDIPLDIVNGLPVYRFTPSVAGIYSISVNNHRDDPCTAAIEPEAAIL